MMNHKYCIALIALLAALATVYMYRHQMMRKQDDVKIQTCWQNESGDITCSQPQNRIIAG